MTRRSQFTGYESVIWDTLRSKPEKIWTKQELKNPLNPNMTDHQLAVTMHRLRDKVLDLGWDIKSVHRVGYCLRKLQQ